jgi:hypothetical protein
MLILLWVSTRIPTPCAGRAADLGVPAVFVNQREVLDIDVHMTAEILEASIRFKASGST